MRETLRTDAGPRPCEVGKGGGDQWFFVSGGKFDQAIVAYAVSYADQVEKDYQAVRAAVRAGRFPTEISPSETEAAIL